MRNRLVLLLATVSGVAVGNVYFPQSITPAIAAGLHVSPGDAALVITAAQAGYTAGLFLLVPLGDRVPVRRLLPTLLVVTGLALLGAACSPSLPVLAALSLMIGTSTVVAPIIGPFVAGLVPASRRGVTNGLLLSGGTGGMLLARTLSGYLASWWSWRVPYALAGVLVLALAVVVARALPDSVPATRSPYPRLLLSPLRLFREERDLRRSCLYQATIFGGFSAVWACVALLLTGPAYGYDARAVALLALVNAGTMIVTPMAGRLVDVVGPDRVTVVCAGAVIVSAVLLALASSGSLVMLVLGTLLLDVAMQSGMTANVVRIYALSSGARSRLNTAYMTCAYLGGAAGSWIGLRSYAAFGWLGVCALVGALAVVPVVSVLVPSRATLALR
ncbi:MFS transporter [Paractinoplanes globisporus]|uniref:MFS transporter n=1 Tax=Paractinoplanes globisporus TaxID=113565 RepID=A0ABW6WM38_9ACTN|nr:MFS transporter [Actinoplanes globisporus]